MSLVYIYSNDKYKLFENESKNVVILSPSMYWFKVCEIPTKNIAKAKNIAKWVFENYTGKKARKTHNNKELIVTRRERALLNSKERYNKVHKKISNLITGIFADEYKKSNGSWNISKLAKDVGCSRNTIYKHLQHLQKEGII